MNRLEKLQHIIQEVTSLSLTLGLVKDAGIGNWIGPSPVVNTLSFEDVYFYDVVVLNEDQDTFESDMSTLLRCKTTLDFDYNDFDSRGYISVTDGTEFSVTDTITGGTSGATGTIYKIDGNTLYLKDITGTWQNPEAILTYSSSTTSLAITTLFPFFLNVTKVEERYDVETDYSEASMSGWLRFEARWAL